VPFDSIRIEVVEDGEAGLRGPFLSCSVVGLGTGRVSSSSVGPMDGISEFDGGDIDVVPADPLAAVVNNTACPEVSLGILGNEPVEGVLPLGGVEGDRLHAHQVAVLFGFTLGELGALLSKLPSDNVADAIGREVGNSVVGGATVDRAEVRAATGAGAEAVWLSSHRLGLAEA